MPIFNTSYRNKDYYLAKKELLGKPFSFMKRIKLKGVGSSRLAIAEISPALYLKELPPVSDTIFANIELRPKGIVVHFRYRLDTFSWVIPYYKLVIYDAQFYTIHANGNFIRFLKDNHYKYNQKFLKKLFNMRNQYLNDNHSSI